MRILAVSDRVVDHLYASDVRQRYPSIDLLIGCGDLPFYYLEFLTSALDVPLIYVRGNHDTLPQYTSNGRILTYAEGGIDLHRRVTRVNDLLVAGLEGSMRYRSGASGMYSQSEMFWNACLLSPRLLKNRLLYGRALDILVTHSPPFQIHDAQDRAHQGFKSFVTLVKCFRPHYLLHGHIHRHRRDHPNVTRFHDTTIVNVYPYRVFEYGVL